jgi:hypothetical protein
MLNIDYETEKKIEAWAPLVIILLGLFIFRNRIGYTNLSISLFLGILISLGWIIGSQFKVSFKYSTPQVIGDNFHGSCSCPPEHVGNWVIIRVGGILSDQWFYEAGNDFLLIIPKGNVKYIGDQILLTVKLDRTYFDDLDIDVQDYLISNNLARISLVSGCIPISQSLDTKAFDVHNENKLLKNRISEMKKILDGKQKIIEEAVSSGSRIANVSNRKGIFGEVKNKFGGGNSGE